jgi:hypothetical protein
MSAWVSAAPVIGTGSLDGFAAAALMSVVCAMATTAPRHARPPSAARGGAQAAERNGWPCEHVMAAEAVRIEVAGAGVAAAEATAPAVVGAAGGGRCGKAAAGHRSRHRRGGPNPVRAPRDRAPRDGVSPGIVFPDAEVALVPFGSPRRPEARRLPRHAAPSVGLGSRMTGFGRRMTGLFATRALADGARG